MPKPSQRTRSRGIISKKLPGKGRKTHYKQKAASLLRCDFCHLPIAGIPRTSTSEMRKLNRTKRRISRPYGGQICHSCLKTAIKQAARTI